MAVRFRNLTVTPQDPVPEWGVEGQLIAIERGGVDEWRQIARAVVADPTGPVAQDFGEAASIAESPGAVAAIRNTIRYLSAQPREVTVRRLTEAFVATELTQAAAAQRLRTSAPRLSTYLSGHVVPSAEFLTRLEMLAAKRVAEARA